jgi:polyhydroxybutyrate depolymerase
MRPNSHISEPSLLRIVLVFEKFIPASARESSRSKGRFLRQVCILAAAFAATLAAVSGSAVANSEPPPGRVASAGCGMPATTPGESTAVFAAAGKSGSYIQDVPVTTGPRPLVIDLHGAVEPAWLHHFESGLGAFGDAHGFITITPQIDDPGPALWDARPGSADISYLRAMLSHVEQSLCIDQRRVYVAGLSMGSFAASALACQLADRIAAVAAVSGLQDYSWCHPARPVPVVAFNGTADPIMAYNGGVGFEVDQATPVLRALGIYSAEPPGYLPQSRSIPSQVEGWAKRNGCGPRPTRTHVAPDVTLAIYPCPADSAVEFYTIIGGGHTWPGNNIYPDVIVGATTKSIDTDQIMWDFFQAHPLSEHGLRAVDA